MLQMYCAASRLSESEPGLNEAGAPMAKLAAVASMKYKENATMIFRLGGGVSRRRAAERDRRITDDLSNCRKRIETEWLIHLNGIHRLLYP